MRRPYLPEISNRGDAFTLNTTLSVSRIGITGSPGTGKKTLATELADMTGLEVVSLNEVAIHQGTGSQIGTEFMVDITRLKKKKIDTRGKIVVGHLLPFVIPSAKLDFVAILRCSPRVLRERYKKRGYSMEKSIENTMAEILDIVSYSTLKKYGRSKVSEFDTTRVRNPRFLAKNVIKTIEGERPKHYGRVNWLTPSMRTKFKLRETLRS